MVSKNSQSSKLFLLVFLTLFILPFISAERYENNLFRYGEIEPSGNLITTNTPINNVGVSGYVCISSNCNSVLGKLWAENFNSGSSNPKDFIQLTYPTSLLSPYGYGIYMYKDGYIPYEVSANWWGTCPSCDPTGPWNNYLTKKQLCQSNINQFDVHIKENDVIDIDLTIKAPITHDGPLDYVPNELSKHYSTTVKVNLEVKKLTDESIIYTDSKTLTIPYSDTQEMTFENFNLPQGEYEIKVYTTLNTEEKCIDFTKDIKTKIIEIGEPPECTKDSDCGTDYYSNKYCEGKKVYKDFHDFYCALNECEEDITKIFVEQCAGDCVNGECIEPPECTKDSDCGTDYYSDKYCEGKKVYKDFHDFYCALNECEEDITKIFVEQCTGDCVNGECQDIICNENSDCDDNDLYTYDECNNPGTSQSYCTNTLMNCVTNNDCGITGFLGTEYCASNDLFKNFKTSTCINPATIYSYCDLFLSSILITDCGEDSCGSWSDNFCQNGDVYKSRTCFDKGCSSNTCFSNVLEDKTKVQNCAFGCKNGACIMPECTIDFQCGSDYIDYYCVSDDKYSETHDFECTGFECSETITNTFLEECEYGCTNGECQNQCNQDSDCGTDFYSNKYCEGKKVYKDFHDFSCLIGECEEDITKIFVEECTFNCENGECISILPDCMDGNDNDGDGLIDMADPGCECPTDNDETDCYRNSDCGIDACTGADNFCQNNDVFQLFNIYTCNNPGQGNSFCSQSIAPQLIKDCGTSNCVDGECQSISTNIFKKTKKPKKL